MDRPELKLVSAEPGRRRSPAAAGLGVAVLAAAVIATAFGADAARRPFRAGKLAESALARTLAANDPQPVAEARAILRERLRRTPLDAVSRTIAASLETETATTDSERSDAVEQVLAATRLVTSDEWVSRGAARVLARCGRTDLALREIARMFEYAPDDAATTLAQLEPFIPQERIEDGVPESAAAWLAWSYRLRATGREAEADTRISALLRLWPGDLQALRVAASVAAGQERIDELLRLVPPSLALPDLPESASLMAFRARSKSAAGDPKGSLADARAAIVLSGNDPWVIALAGDAVEKTEPALARDYWTRALFRLLEKPGARADAIRLRVRLARLDDREGRAGDALREWRTILAERPDNGEAKRRVAELTGERPQ